MCCCLHFVFPFSISMDCLRWHPAYLLNTSWQIPNSSNKSEETWTSIMSSFPMFLSTSNPKKNLRWRWPSDKVLCILNQLPSLVLWLNIETCHVFASKKGERIIYEVEHSRYRIFISKRRLNSPVNTQDIFGKARVTRKSETHQPHVLWSHLGNRIFGLSRKN